MYNYKISKSDSDKISAIYNDDIGRDGLDQLVSKIKQIDDMYSTSDIPEYIAPDFEKLNPIDVDQSNILKQAESSLYEYKKSSEDKINDSYSTQYNSLQNEKDKLSNSVADNKASISTYYESARNRVSNDALNRGLARSSIVINELDAFDRSEIDEYKRIDKEYSDAIDAINFKIDSLEVERTNAFNDFDIAYAVKLNDKINSLTAELEKKNADVIKYNNEIAEKEKKYLDSYNDMVADINKENKSNNQKLIELKSKYGEKAVNKYRKEQIVDVLDKFFANLDNAGIARVLNDSSIKEVLGSDFDEILARYK